MNSKIDKTIVVPAFLVEAESYIHGCEKVGRFLDLTPLIRYDNIDFAFGQSCSAADPNFWEMVDSACERNNRTVNELIRELQNNGFSQMTELAQIKQGYESKVLHTLVHLLDGFIGIDTSLYNLAEDSHQISDNLRQKISKQPRNYWLLQAEAENPQTLI